MIGRNPESWVERGQRVEARNAAGDQIHAAGKVIAYLNAPSVIIRTDDGKEVTWLVSLTKPVGESCNERTNDLRVPARCNKPANHYGERHTADLGVGTYTWGYLAAPEPGSDA